MENTANIALTVTEDYLETQTGIQETAKTIGTYNASQWCPAAVSLPQEWANDFALQVRNVTYEIGIQLRDVSARIESEVKGIESDLEGLINIVHDVDSSLDDIKKYINAAKVLVIFIDMIVLSLMIACALAWIGRQNFFSKFVRNAIVIPVFVVLLILFWMFSTLALMGAMAGADFCAVPDESTVSIILKKEDNFSSLVLVLLLYYVTVSCNLNARVFHGMAMWLYYLSHLDLNARAIFRSRVVCQRGYHQS